MDRQTNRKTDWKYDRLTDKKQTEAEKGGRGGGANRELRRRRGWE